MFCCVCALRRAHNFKYCQLVALVLCVYILFLLSPPLYMHTHTHRMLNTDDIHDRIALRAQHNQCCERFKRNVFYSQILRIRMYHALIHASRAMTLSEFVKLFERFDFIGILIEITLKSVFFFCSFVILGWHCLFFFLLPLAGSLTLVTFVLVFSQTVFFSFSRFLQCNSLFGVVVS